MTRWGDWLVIDAGMRQSKIAKRIFVVVVFMEVIRSGLRMVNTEREG